MGLLSMFSATALALAALLPYCPLPWPGCLFPSPGAPPARNSAQPAPTCAVFAAGGVLCTVGISVPSWPKSAVSVRLHSVTCFLTQVRRV